MLDALEIYIFNLCANFEMVRHISAYVDTNNSSLKTYNRPRLTSITPSFTILRNKQEEEELGAA